MKINSGKTNILFSRNDNVSANIDDNTIISENKNELLGIIQKASQKLNTLISKSCSIHGSSKNENGYESI